jgi:hypothetical protein
MRQIGRGLEGSVPTRLVPSGIPLTDDDERVEYIKETAAKIHLLKGELDLQGFLYIHTLYGWVWRGQEECEKIIELMSKQPFMPGDIRNVRSIFADCLDVIQGAHYVLALYDGEGKTVEIIFECD